MRRWCWVACGLTIARLAGAALASAPLGTAIDIDVVPPQPLIEPTRLGQDLNFDFRIQNRAAAPLTLRQVLLRVRDESGNVIRKIEINDNGVAPGIEAIPHRKLSPGESLTLFNPFHTLPRDVPLAALDYELTFSADKGPDVSKSIAVSPRPHSQRTRLRLPLDGRVLVWDGHDFYAHHRRLDFEHPFIKEVGLHANSSRYAYDFVVVDEAGEQYHGDPGHKPSHYSYGRPVICPGDGTVVAAVNAAAEKPFAIDDARRDMMTIFGNYIVIDHGNSEFSLLGHLKPGSVRVKPGQRVRAGQRLARVGDSGASLFPHLHYELVSGPGIHHEGLPSQFSGFDQILGGRRVSADGTSPASGDIIESRDR